MGRPKNFSREEVLEKAIPLFWKNGFADTSLQDLEKATGVNKSGLYSEFVSKEDLYLASLRHYLEQRNGLILLAEPLGFHNIENFLKAVGNCAGGQKGCFAINSMREVAVVPAETQEIVLKNQAQLKRGIARNIAAEKTKMDVEVMAEIIMTYFIGLCLEQNLKSKKGSAGPKIEEFVKAMRSL